MEMSGIQNLLSKSCFKCGAEKPLTEFYKHHKMADGHLNKCKECTKKDSTENRVNNLETVRKYDRDRPNREQRNKERVERARRDYQKSPEKFRERQQHYRWLEPHKYRARSSVLNAVRDGRLLRPDSCEKCSKVCVPEGHHWSYDKQHWLDVEWVCSSCHHLLHSDVDFL